MTNSFWKPQALDNASALESAPPPVPPSDAQVGCNFIIWMPDSPPTGCHIAPGTLRREAPPGRSESTGRTPWSQNNPSAYRYEIIGTGRRLRVKQFLYDWAFPALDHPCLWESETRAVPLRGPYVLWFGVDYMKNRAASARLGRTLIEFSVLEGDFTDDEITAVYRSLRPASVEAVAIISQTPFRMLSYWARYPEASMVNVLIGLWKFLRPDKAHEGQWAMDSSGVKALLDEFGLPSSVAGFHIDSVARFANSSGQSEVEALYTSGSDQGQELRLIVQAIERGRIEFPPEPEVHPCKRSAAVIGGCEADIAWIDELYGPFDAVWRDKTFGLDFKLLSYRNRPGEDVVLECGQ